MKLVYFTKIKYRIAVTFAFWTILCILGLSEPKAVTVPSNGFFIFKINKSRVFRICEVRSVPLGADNTRLFFMSKPREAAMPKFSHTLARLYAVIHECTEQIADEVCTLRTVEDAMLNPGDMRSYNYNHVLGTSANRIEAINQVIFDEVSKIIEKEQAKYRKS